MNLERIIIPEEDPFISRYIESVRSIMNAIELSMPIKLNIYERDKGKVFIERIFLENELKGLRNTSRNNRKFLKKYLFSINALKHDILREFDDISYKSKVTLYQSLIQFVPGGQCSIIFSEQDLINILNSPFDEDEILKFGLNLLKNRFNGEIIFRNESKALRIVKRTIKDSQIKKVFTFDLFHYLKKQLATYSYFQFTSEEDVTISLNQSAVFTAKLLN